MPLQCIGSIEGAYGVCIGILLVKGLGILDQVHGLASEKGIREREVFRLILQGLRLVSHAVVYARQIPQRLHKKIVVAVFPGHPHVALQVSQGRIQTACTLVSTCDIGVCRSLTQRGTERVARESSRDAEQPYRIALPPLYVVEEAAVEKQVVSRPGVGEIKPAVKVEILSRGIHVLLEIVGIEEIVVGHRKILWVSLWPHGRQSLTVEHDAGVKIIGGGEYVPDVDVYRWQTVGKVLAFRNATGLKVSLHCLGITLPHIEDVTPPLVGEGEKPT